MLPTNGLFTDGGALLFDKSFGQAEDKPLPNRVVIV